MMSITTTISNTVRTILSSHTLSSLLLHPDRLIPTLSLATTTLVITPTLLVLGQWIYLLRAYKRSQQPKVTRVETEKWREESIYPPGMQVDVVIKTRTRMGTGAWVPVEMREE